MNASNSLRKELLAYCKKTLHNLSGRSFGHWHYTYLYYSQVVYRQGRKLWEPFRDKLYDKVVSDLGDNENETDRHGHRRVTVQTDAAFLQAETSRDVAGLDRWAGL